MEKFITLKEYIKNDTGTGLSKQVDPVVLTQVLLESISSKDFAKALAKLASLNFSPGVMQQINEDRGRLKRLVGKEPDAYLDSADTLKIGTMIANMDGTNRRDYMGIINFLGASCRIHHELKESYINEVRAQREEGRKPQLSEEDMAAIKRAEELGRKEDEEKERAKAQKDAEAQEAPPKGVGQPQSQEETQMGRS